MALIRYTALDNTPCVGSGLLVDVRTVLTADHVADGGKHRIECAGKTRDVVQVLRSGTSNVDLALLTIGEPVDGIGQLGCARVERDRFGRVDGCIAVGFPRWRKDGDQRRSAQVDGIVPTAEGLDATANSGLRAGLLTLVGNRTPGAPNIPAGMLTEEPRANPWGGMSGAGVVVGDLVIGVVRSHNLAAGGQSLTVTPLSAIDTLADETRKRFWEALGVADSNALEVIPLADGSLSGGPPVIASIPPAETSAPASRHIVRTLPRDIPDFTGREAEVEYLLDTLRTRGFAGNNAVAIHAVDGMAGIGKTTLAIHVGHRLDAEYPDALFLDLRAYTEGQAPMDSGEALEILMTMLGLTGDQIPTQFDQRVARWRSELAGRRALIVLDNAASPEQVQPLLPGESGCLVVITSRVRLIGLHGVSPLTLDTMKPADAIQLFRLIAGVDRVTAEPGPVAAVALRCGYLPLAIRLVASWLRHHPAKSVEHILDRLTGTLSPISTALELSYRDLNYDQQLMFKRLGLHPGQTFTPETAGVLTDVELDRAQELLDELYDRNLIEEPQSNRYRFHDLTRDYARNLVNNRDPESDRRTAMSRLFDYYIDTIQQQQSMQEYSWFDDELPELLSCAHYAVTHGETGYAWRLPQALAVVLQLRGLYRQARVLHAGALEAACEHSDKRAQAAIYIDLSIVDREANDRHSALSHCVESLRLYEECGDEHGQANANTELGVVYGEIGDYGNAQEHLTKALNLYIKLGNEIGQGNVQLALGVLCREMGDYHQADTHLKRALDIYGGNRHGQADTYLGLGILAKLMGAYSEARDDLVTALRLYTELGSQQGEATLHTELGDLCDLVGDRTEALRHWQQAKTLYAEMRR